MNHGAINAMSYNNLGSADQLAQVVTGREVSCFAAACEAARNEISSRLAGARVLVIGGAGSIGSATVRLLARHSPAALHVCDLSENYLADLVRDLRNTEYQVSAREFRTFTLDYGGQPMRHLLEHEQPYDFILNFAAHKHVRGERDGYTLISMIETNILKLAAFKGWATTAGHGRRFFSVSTDKAANPSSLMGASKRLMEDVLFEHAPLTGAELTTARFANVAFSNGSLLQAFLRRMAKGEPLAVPEATRRYFVTPAESGELCLLASVMGENGTIAIPDFDPQTALVELRTIAEALLERAGLIPVLTRDEDEARSLARAITATGGSHYPVLLTPLDTAGEKPYEEFVAANEFDVPWLPGLRAITHRNNGRVGAMITRFFEILSTGGSEAELAKVIRAAFQDIVDHFKHRTSERSLDDRL
jgi:FlaA1/EpsC-like NDP-sugar epimerase